jgi:hypothetical protein
MGRSFLLAGLLAAFAVPAAAQTIGTPIYKSPYRAFKRTELAGYLSDPGEGISIALQGEYRIARPKFDFGIVVGFLDASGNGDGTFGVGLDGRAVLTRHSQDFPLDASLTGGFGALFRSGDAGFLLPVGVTLGRQVLLEESNISFTPYVNPVIVPVFGNDNVVGNDVQFALGLGVDIAITTTFDIRVSGSLGDIDGLGVGLAWHR